MRTGRLLADVPPAAVGGTGPRPGAPQVREVRAALDAVADDLTRLWTSAVRRGDFTEIDQLVEASQAVHRAAIALGRESRGPSR